MFVFRLNNLVIQSEQHMNTEMSLGLQSGAILGLQYMDIKNTFRVGKKKSTKSIQVCSNHGAGFIEAFCIFNYKIQY